MSQPIHALLDINVILDFFEARKPFNTEAIAVFQSIYNKKFVACVSANSYTNIYYYLRKSIGRNKAIEQLSNLKKITHLLQVNDVVINRALLSNITDFEDAVQNECAVEHGNINYIITRNSKDFKHSSLIAIAPFDFLQVLKNKK